MSRQPLPPGAKKVQVSLTLTAATLAAADALVASGAAATRSAAIDALVAKTASSPPPRRR